MRVPALISGECRPPICSMFSSYGNLMRKPRLSETDEQRSAREDREAQKRRDDSAAEDRALDAMVRQSLKQHGP